MVGGYREMISVVLIFVGVVLTALGSLGLLIQAIFRLKERFGYKGEYVMWTSLAIGWVGVIFWLIGLVLSEW